METQFLNRNNFKLYSLYVSSSFQSIPDDDYKICKELNYFYLRSFHCIHGLNFIAAIAAEGEQNAVDYCCNNGNYYFDTLIQMLIESCVNYYFSISLNYCFRTTVLVSTKKKHLKKYVNHVSSLSTIQSNNKFAVDSGYVLRQFLTPLPSIDFREIRGLIVLYQSCSLTSYVI
jgi:hypothetical protein